jgi:hypothetical protein
LLVLVTQLQNRSHTDALSRRCNVVVIGLLLLGFFQGSADVFCSSMFTLSPLFIFVKFFKEISDSRRTVNLVAIASGVRPRCVNASDRRFGRHQNRY